MMSDNPMLHTGMAVVLREVALGLHKTGKYEIVIAGWGYNGYPHNFPFPMLPASTRDFAKDGYPHAGIPGFAQMIDAVKPDVVWALGDAWMLNYIKDLPNRNKFKYVQYMPIDGSPVPDYWTPWIDHVDQLVLYSQYGVDEVNKTAPHIKPELIYHGTHPERYYPLPQAVRNEIKSKIVYQTVNDRNQIEQRSGLPEDAFIIGTLARNQPRKNFDKVIKAFKLFSADKPNAYLWLHTAMQDAAYNLPQLVHTYKLYGKVLFTPNYTLVNGLPENELNMLMNIWDAHFLPTQGEGFGIPILETMSAGCPQVVTDYTSHMEWCSPASELIPVVEDDDFITGIPHPVERAIPKPSECVKCLNNLYHNVEHKNTLAKNARQIAESMTWDKTIPDWDRVITETFNGTNKNKQARLASQTDQAKLIDFKSFDKI
jgi:glycosyltransferase involved in cell wall biosynthesis